MEAKRQEQPPQINMEFGEQSLHFLEQTCPFRWTGKSHDFCLQTAFDRRQSQHGLSGSGLLRPIHSTVPCE